MPAKCNVCMACIAPCPTGAIDNWRRCRAREAYAIEEQLGWDALPAEKSARAWRPRAVRAATRRARAVDRRAARPRPPRVPTAASGATVPPWSAAHPYVNLYTHAAPATATVAGNFRVTDAASENDTHHIVLDFGATPFPVLEGQSIGIVPPGSDAHGRPHHARQYSIASPRDGERPGYNNVSLTVKRVTADHDGKPVRGVCSNYLCDLQARRHRAA